MRSFESHSWCGRDILNISDNRRPKDQEVFYRRFRALLQGNKSRFLKQQILIFIQNITLFWQCRVGKSKARIDRQDAAYLRGSSKGQSLEMRLWFLIWSFPFCLSFEEHVQAVSNGVYALLGLTGNELERVQSSWIQPVLPRHLAGQVDEAQADESCHCKSFYLWVLTQTSRKG